MTVIVGMVWGVLAWKEHQCHAIGKVMGMNVQWSVSTACMIEHKPGKWVPLTRYRVMDEET